jgi:hypothetical protein
MGQAGSFKVLLAAVVGSEKTVRKQHSSRNYLFIWGAFYRF